jgi:hypothetical protein
MIDQVAKRRQAAGERNSQAKLTSEQVVKIFNDPRTPTEISRDYGVAFLTVRDIKRRVTWRSVTDTLPSGSNPAGFSAKEGAEPSQKASLWLGS